MNHCRTTMTTSGRNKCGRCKCCPPRRTRTTARARVTPGCQRQAARPLYRAPRRAPARARPGASARARAARTVWVRDWTRAARVRRVSHRANTPRSGACSKVSTSLPLVMYFNALMSEIFKIVYILQLGWESQNTLHFYNEPLNAQASWTK